jgi:hypothetical protein
MCMLIIRMTFLVHYFSMKFIYQNNQTRIFKEFNILETPVYTNPKNWQEEWKFCYVKF